MESSYYDSTHGTASLNFLTGLPLPAPDCILNTTAEILIRKICSYQNEPKYLPSLLQCATIERLQQISENMFDIVEMDDLSFLRYVQYQTFPTPLANDLLSLERVYDTYKLGLSPTSRYYSFQSCNNTHRIILPHDDDIPFNCDYQTVIRPRSAHISAPHYYEVSRSAFFDNGLLLSSSTPFCHETIAASLPFGLRVIFDPTLLLMSGDVESNPGPTSLSKFDDADRLKRQQREINELQKQIRKLNKQEHQRQRCLQRQLELEKRDRNRKRKDANYSKYYAQGLTDFTNNLGQVASDLSANVGPTLRLLQEALSKLSEAGASIKEAFSFASDFDICSIIMALISIGQCIFSKQLLMLTLHVGNLARLLGVSLSGLLTLIPTFTQNESVQYNGTSNDSTTNSPLPVAESLFTDMFTTATNHPDLLPFTSLLAFVAGIFNLACTGTLPTPTTMLKHFTNVGRAAQGFKAVKDIFKWTTEYLMELYYKTVYGIPKEDYDFMKEYPRLEKLYAASQIIKELESTVISNSAAIANQILSLNCELQDYLVTASRSPTKTHYTMIQTVIRTISTQVEYARSSPARVNTIREEPVVLMLYGLPGVGKSVATQALKAKIFKEFLSSRGLALKDCSYTRKSKNDFWDGYTGQPIVELDDFGNVRDSLNKPVEEYTELEYMVNNAPYPLHMAEIKSKGNTNFTSEYILATTNQLYPDIKHLVDSGAVYRRLHICAKVTIDPAYGSQRGLDSAGNPYYMFDVAQAAKAEGVSVSELSPLITSHYRFTMYSVSMDYKTGRPVVSWDDNLKDLTFDQFWDHFLTVSQTRKSSNQKLAEELRKLAGVELEGDVETEKDILDRLKVVFDADTLMEELLRKNVAFADCSSSEKNELFATPTFAQRITTNLTEAFDKARSSFVSLVKSFWSSIKTVANIATNKLLGLGTFILSFFRDLAFYGPSHFTNPHKTDEVSTYDPDYAEASAHRIPYVFYVLPHIPRITTLFNFAIIVSGILSIVCHAFLRNHSLLTSCCAFSNAPTPSLTPCRNCQICKVFDYPETGNMLHHWLDRLSVRQVREEVEKLGMDTSRYGVLAHTYWTDRIREADQSARAEMIRLFAEDAYMNSVSTDGAHYVPSAQGKTYDNGTLTARQRPMAQRIYGDTTHVARQRPMAQHSHAFYAESYVEAKTPIYSGAICYAQRDRVQIEQTTQVLLKNSVWVQAVDANNRASRSNGVFLVGRTLLTTAHTLLTPPGDAPFVSIHIKNPYATQPSLMFPYKECKFTQLTQLDGTKLDLVLVSLPPVVPSRPNILSKFINASDVDKIKEGKMVFSGFTDVNNLTIVHEKFPSAFSISTKQLDYLLHSPGTCPKSTGDCTCTITISNHIDYDLETYKGMCGSLLSVDNNLVHTKLVGIHVAGGAGSLAIGAITTRQLLQDNLERHIASHKLPSTYLIDGRMPHANSLVDTSKMVSMVDEGDCISVGKVDKHNCPTNSTKTQLKPSLIHDEVQEHTTIPALLTKTVVAGVAVDPMIKGIKKVLGPQTWIDPDLLEAAANDVFQNLGPPPTGKGIIHSHEESIIGVQDDKMKRPVNRITSPGFPYILDPNKQKGKTYWLGKDEEYKVDDPDLLKDVEELISLARKGIRGSAISIATLKDEKRPIEKVLQGKTRVFEACPLHLVLAIRRYFLDFTAHVMRNRIKNGICVGINPSSLEWTTLANHLLSKGNKMVAGDFSNFDGSLVMQVLIKILEKINDWYNDGDENALIRACLWEHISNADVLVKDEVIRQTHSQPSGNPLTVIVNSLFNGIIMRVAYLMLKQENGWAPICDYSDHVAEAIYGDDDVKSISSDTISWFNQQTITCILAKIGLTYTDESKSGTDLLWKPLSEITFLKRKFVPQPLGEYFGAMPVENILETTNWVKGKQRRAATIENCDMVVSELAFHPRPEYEKWCSRIRVACAKKGINFKFPTWFEQQQRIREEQRNYASIEYDPLW